MVLNSTASMDDREQPLELVDLPLPLAEKREILIEVSVCGVCHTELDEVEGRAPPSMFPIVPGHEVVGRVVEMGEDCRVYSPGDRVGVCRVAG